MSADRRLPDPLEVVPPPGAEGWEQMYSPYLLFSAENAEWERAQFWYWDGMHRPDVEYPFDTIVHEAYMMSVAAIVSRLFAVPGAKGAASRVLLGRLYLADIPFERPADEEVRFEQFARRAGHYFEHWEELSERWVAKVDALTDELAALEIPTLPELEDMEVVTSGRGTSSGHGLLVAYERIIGNVFRVYQYHFEMLVLAYAAQLNFQDFCRAMLSAVTERSLSTMMAGVELEQFRPDEELKTLARLAVRLGVAQDVRRPHEESIMALRAGQGGREWLDALEAAKDPWFHVSAGTGLFHTERAWIDDLSVPWAAIGGYIDRLERGEEIDRPRDALIAERDRLTAEYRALLGGPEQATFDANLALARLVAPHMQNHNFHIEHRHHTHFWNHMRTLGDRLAEAGLVREQEDLFYLNRWEVGQALFDAANSWAQVSPGRPRHWGALVERRREIVEVLRGWVPEPAVGTAPESIGGIVSAQFGITMETVRAWLANADTTTERVFGIAASGGVAEGPARVVLRTDQLHEVRDGEILVCPATAPAWAPVFGTIRGVVSDVGGAMSHAAILCREYGTPAVLGTGVGTRMIRTGDRVRVDGDAGVVEVLERNGDGA